MIHRAETAAAMRIAERLERTSSDRKIAAGVLRPSSFAGAKAGALGAGSGDRFLWVSAARAALAACSCCAFWVFAWLGAGACLAGSDNFSSG